MVNQNFHLHKFTMDKYCLFISFLTAISAFLYLYLLNRCMDNYNKFILIPKLSKKQFIVKTTAYKNQNVVV